MLKTILSLSFFLASISQAKKHHHHKHKTHSDAKPAPELNKIPGKEDLIPAVPEPLPQLGVPIQPYDAESIIPAVELSPDLLDRLPDSIKMNHFPDYEIDENDHSISFEIPHDIRHKLFQDQNDVLSGACAHVYRNYADSERMDDIKSILGEQAYDAMVEAILYDYAHGDCNWVDMYFGQLVGEFKYVKKSKAGIFAGISGRGSVVHDIIEYFAYWIEGEMRRDRVLYSDGVLEWKMMVAQAFQKLKKEHELIQQGKGTPKELKCERVDPVNFFRERPKGLKEGMVDFDRLFGGGAEEEDDAVEEIEHIPINENVRQFAVVSADEEDGGVAKRADLLAAWLVGNAKSDVVGPKNKNGDPDPTGYTVTVSFLADVCLGVSIKIGAGIAINVITGEQAVTFTYGFGSTDDSRPQQDMRVQVSHYCESSIEWGSVWSVGYVLPNNVAYNHLYTPDFAEFLGISFEKGYLHDYKESEGGEEGSLNFAWYRNVRLAKRIAEKHREELAKKKAAAEAAALEAQKSAVIAQAQALRGRVEPGTVKMDQEKPGKLIVNPPIPPPKPAVIVIQKEDAPIAPPPVKKEKSVIEPEKKSSKKKSKKKKKHKKSSSIPSAWKAPAGMVVLALFAMSLCLCVYGAMLLRSKLFKRVVNEATPLLKDDRNADPSEMSLHEVHVNL